MDAERRKEIETRLSEANFGYTHINNSAYCQDVRDLLAEVAWMQQACDSHHNSVDDLIQEIALLKRVCDTQKAAIRQYEAAWHGMEGKAASTSGEPTKETTE